MKPVAIVAATLALVASLCGPLAAQTYPSKPLTIISPYAPGTTDQQMRVLAPVLQRIGGQTVLVENRPGAGGAIGARAVATAPGDGYTLLYAAPAVLTVLPLIQSTPYRATDFTPVARITSSPHLMAVRASAPFATLPEMIAYAKANPGRITFGSSGTGTAVHLAGEAFARAAGITVNHIPFKGLNEAITQVLTGQIDFIVGVPVAILPLVADGRMKAVAQFGAARSPVLPDVPTLREQGVDLALSVDIGLFAPKGVDAATLQGIDRLFAEAMQSAEFTAYAKTARVSADFLPAAEFGQLVAADAHLQDGLVTALGLRK